MALGYEVHEITTYVPRSAFLVGYMHANGPRADLCT